MCWHSDPSFRKKQYLGIMDFNLFKKIIDEAASSGTKAITMASRGEPTLNPCFPDMLDYCANKFLEIKINTNAIKLSDKVIHSLLKNNVNSVVFSVDSYNREDYLKIRKKDCFDEVVKNIERFNFIRTVFYDNLRTVTRIHGVRADKNLNEKEFITFWSKYCDQVSIGDCDQRWDIYNNEKVNRSKGCSFLYDRMYVWYDGTCNVCDPDYKSKLTVGSVLNNSLAEIWNGKAYKKLILEHFILDSLPEPCDRCSVGL